MTSQAPITRREFLTLAVKALLALPLLGLLARLGLTSAGNSPGVSRVEASHYKKLAG